MNTGPLGKGTPVLFEVDENDQLPSGLEVQDMLVTTKGGKASRIGIDIQNTIRHDINFKSRTVLGRLQLVQSVTPVEVKLKSDHGNTQQPIVSESSDFVVRETHDCTSIDLPEHLKDVNLGDLTSEQRILASQLLNEQADAFSKNDDEVGCIPNLQMDIPLNDKTPVQKNYVAVPRPLYPEVKSYVENLLNRNFIRRSSSSYSSPVVCVRKKDHTLRLCVEYRKLNGKTQVDRHPIPRIQETLDNLGGNSWFSVLDQGKAYHQGFVKPESQPLTAFITPWGLYEWIRIPFSLTNAPASFQRFMETCLSGLRDEICVPYLDDIIVFSPSFNDHIEHLRKVHKRLKEHGVKLKPKIVQCLREKFLGRVVSEKGNNLDPSTIAPILRLKESPPKTVNEVRKLMGFLNYYRRHIENFSKIAKPIYDLVKSAENYTTSPKTTKKLSEKQWANHPVSWTPAHQTALEKLISCLVSAQVMAYPDPNSPYVLHTDASETGLGAVLYQEQHGIL